MGGRDGHGGGEGGDGEEESREGGSGVEEPFLDNLSII